MGMRKRVEPGSLARNLIFGALMSAGLASVSAGVQAQTATISGVLGSFDVVNMSGQPAHGFEIQMEGATANDLYYTASADGTAPARSCPMRPVSTFAGPATTVP